MPLVSISVHLYFKDGCHCLEKIVDMEFLPRKGDWIAVYHHDDTELGPEVMDYPVVFYLDGRPPSILFDYGGGQEREEIGPDEYKEQIRSLVKNGFVLDRVTSRNRL